MNRLLSDRRGSLMVELLACGAILAVIVSTAIPALRWIVRQRKLTDERQAAMLEVDNLMERITALDWNDLTTERAAQFKLAPALSEQLSESKLNVVVEADPDDPAAKIVRISLSWEYFPERTAPPVRLAAWVHRGDRQALPEDSTLEK